MKSQLLNFNQVKTLLQWKELLVFTCCQKYKMRKSEDIELIPLNSQLIYNSLITPWFIYHSKSAPQNVDCSKLPNALGLKGNSYSLNKLYVKEYIVQKFKVWSNLHHLPSKWKLTMMRRPSPEKPNLCAQNFWIHQSSHNLDWVQ